MTASTLIDPIAVKLAAIAGAVEDVTAYSKDPGMAGLEGNPIAVVGIPTIDRGDIDSDSQLGSRDWVLGYPVRLYVNLEVPDEAQTLLQDTCEAFMRAIDADDQLASIATVNMVPQAARAIEALPGEIVGETSRPRLFYDVLVRVHALTA